MKTKLLALALTVVTATGCSGSNNSTPTNHALGLWQAISGTDEDIGELNGGALESNSAYLEITEDQYIVHTPDRLSNCYNTFSLSIEHISGNLYLVDGVPSEKSELTLKASESNLTTSISSETQSYEYVRVVNISSQDFNFCTL